MPDIRLESIVYKGHTLKVGHPVRVLPSKKGGRDGYDSLVKAFLGQVVEVAGAKKGKITGIEVTDPSTGATRTFGPERIIPYLRNVDAKATTLAERKKVVPIGSGKARATKATGATKATRAK